MTESLVLDDQGGWYCRSGFLFDERTQDSISFSPLNIRLLTFREQKKNDSP